jgi:Domain of unknown function (DUF4873)
MISHDGDGFTGVARLTVGATLFNVLVELRGYFEPIDGRYHWYGRVSRNDSLADVLTGSRASAVLETEHGSSPCELTDPDLWGRYRVQGRCAPPFPVAIRA